VASMADAPESERSADTAVDHQPGEPQPWWMTPAEPSTPPPAAHAAAAHAAAAHPTAAFPTTALPTTGTTELPGWGQPGTEVPTRHPEHRRGRGVALVAAVAVVSGAVGAGAVALANGGSTPMRTGTAAAAPASSSGPGLPKAQTGAAPTGDTGGTVRSAFGTIKDSVVLINTTTGGGGPDGFSGGFPFSGGSGAAAGTGIILTAGGEVVTNAHVISGATSIKVTVPGHAPVSAKLLGADTVKDLAVLQISGLSGLKPAGWAADSTVKVGDSVVAVGNAEGYNGDPTVSTGIVSALKRNLDDTSGGSSSLSGLIQTDAAINPGNSGGPLVDTEGRVIGINTAVARGTSSEPAQGIGFAIPADTVLAAVPALEAGGGSTGGRVTPGGGAYLGISVGDAQDNSGAPGGAAVGAVSPGGPADTAGLQQGDVITALDGAAVDSSQGLITALRSHKAGDRVTLTVVRGGQSQKVPVTLAAKPSTLG